MRILRRLFCIMLTGTTLLTPYTVAGKTRDRFYFERHSHAYWRINTEQKVVALTFDDGPNEKFTPQILQLLHAYGQTATFFVIGKKVREHPEMIREAVQYGNEIGNHTFTHKTVKNLSGHQLVQEIRQTNLAVKQATGRQGTAVFRPPRGHYNKRIIGTANQMGYSVIMWSWDEDTRDWQRPGVPTIVSHVLKHIHPGDIILFHDGTGNSRQTVDALRIILPRLRELGYRSVTVSELIKLGGVSQHDLEKSTSDDE